MQKDQASTFRNSDVLRRRHESKLQQSTGNKKRKFADATDRISSVAAAVQDKKGDVFRKRVLAIRKHKKSKK